MVFIELVFDYGEGSLILFFGGVRGRGKCCFWERFLRWLGYEAWGGWGKGWWGWWG